MLYDVMFNNKHWRILSSSVADAWKLAGHQSVCGSGVGELPLHHLCFGFVLPFPSLIKLFLSLQPRVFLLLLCLFSPHAARTG